MDAEKRNVNSGIRMVIKAQYKGDSESDEIQLIDDDLSETKSKKQVGHISKLFHLFLIRVNWNYLGNNSQTNFTAFKLYL